MGGKVNSDLLSHYDVMPTLLDYLEVAYTKNNILPGKSFASILRNKPAESGKDSVVICDEYGPNRMLRTPQWKYVYRYSNGPDELYDLINDPLERKNLVNEIEFKGQKELMAKELEEWFQLYVIDQLDGSRLTTCRGGGQKGSLINNSNNLELFESN